jgi:exosortase
MLRGLLTVNDVGRVPVPAAVRAQTALVALIAAAALWVMKPTVASLIDTWQNVRDYEAGFLLAAIAVIWFGLATYWARHLPAQPSFIGASLLGVTLLLWLIALNANSLMAHQLLLPIVLWSAVFATAGWQVARRLSAPIAFLYFTIPVWDHFVPVLQYLSVHAAETALGWLGVTAHVSEYTVRIPEGTFEIIEGCSGKRYFMVGLAIAVLAARHSGMRGRRFVTFVLCCGFASMVANWLRVTTVIYVGHISNMQNYLVAVEHRSFGTVIFAVLLVLISLAARRFAPEIAPSPAAASAEIPSSAPSAPSPGLWRATLPMILLLVAVVVMQIRAMAPRAAASLNPFPVLASTWQGPLPPLPGWAPDYAGSDGARRAAYTSPDGTVEVYANTYAEQTQGKELVNYENTLLAPGDWHRDWPLRTETLTPEQAPPLAAFEADDDTGQRWIIAYQFKVGRWQGTSEATAQLAYGMQSFLRPTPAGVVALASRCNENCEAARALVISFWNSTSASMRAVVPEGQFE